MVTEAQHQTRHFCTQKGNPRLFLTFAPGNMAVLLVFQVTSFKCTWKKSHGKTGLWGGGGIKTHAHTELEATHSRKKLG